MLSALDKYRESYTKLFIIYLYVSHEYFLLNTINITKYYVLLEYACLSLSDMQDSSINCSQISFKTALVIICYLFTEKLLNMSII